MYALCSVQCRAGNCNSGHCTHVNVISCPTLDLFFQLYCFRVNLILTLNSNQRGELTQEKSIGNICHISQVCSSEAASAAFQNRKAIYQRRMERFKRRRPGMLVKRKRSDETRRKRRRKHQNSSMGLFLLMLMSLQNEVRRSKKGGNKRKPGSKQKESRVIQL